MLILIFLVHRCVACDEAVNLANKYSDIQEENLLMESYGDYKQ